MASRFYEHLETANNVARAADVLAENGEMVRGGCLLASLGILGLEVDGYDMVEFQRHPEVFLKVLARNKVEMGAYDIKGAEDVEGLAGLTKDWGRHEHVGTIIALNMIDHGSAPDHAMAWPRSGELPRDIRQKTRGGRELIYDINQGLVSVRREEMMRFLEDTTQQLGMGEEVEYHAIVLGRKR